MLANILRHWFTGKDNESYEVMRALTALCVLIMLAYIGFHLFWNKEFDPLASAGGLGALLFGGGAGSAIKDGTLTGAKKTTVAGDLNTENIENVEMKP